MIPLVENGLTSTTVEQKHSATMNPAAPRPPSSSSGRASGLEDEIAVLGARILVDHARQRCRQADRGDHVSPVPHLSADRPESGCPLGNTGEPGRTRPRKRRDEGLRSRSLRRQRQRGSDRNSRPQLGRGLLAGHAQPVLAAQHPQLRGLPGLLPKATEHRRGRRGERRRGEAGADVVAPVVVAVEQTVLDHGRHEAVRSGNRQTELTRDVACPGWVFLHGVQDRDHPVQHAYASGRPLPRAPLIAVHADDDSACTIGVPEVGDWTTCTARCRCCSAERTT